MGAVPGRLRQLLLCGRLARDHRAAQSQITATRNVRRRSFVYCGGHRPGEVADLRPVPRNGPCRIVLVVELHDHRTFPSIWVQHVILVMVAVVVVRCYYFYQLKRSYFLESSLKCHLKHNNKYNWPISVSFSLFGSTVHVRMLAYHPLMLVYWGWSD